MYREKGYENMVVFEEELENYFDNFTDLAQSFPLFHGKRHEDEDLDEDKAVGYFKVTGYTHYYFIAPYYLIIC